MTVTWLDKSLQSILRHVTCYEYETNEQYKHWMLATHIWDLLSEPTKLSVLVVLRWCPSDHGLEWKQPMLDAYLPHSLGSLPVSITSEWYSESCNTSFIPRKPCEHFGFCLEPFVVRKIRYIEVRLTEVRNRSLQGKGVRYLEVCMSFGNGPKQHSNCGRPRVWTFKMYMSNASSSRTPWPSFNCHAHSDILSMDTLTFDLDGIRMVKRI